jgi:hypothetical protein
MQEDLNVSAGNKRLPSSAFCGSAGATLRRDTFIRGSRKNPVAIGFSTSLRSTDPGRAQQFEAKCQLAATIDALHASAKKTARNGNSMSPHIKFRHLSEHRSGRSGKYAYDK